MCLPIKVKYVYIQWLCTQAMLREGNELKHY
jgi:hypothetical protein